MYVFFFLYPDCPLTHAAPGHYVLWKNGVHHRDISPSNLMVYKTSDGRWIGVLNDFDLSSTQDTPLGQERTGTVPFMALDLLTKEAIEGQVKHTYQHDAEAFIWVLTWVCICYEDGLYIGKRTVLHDWLRVDALGCHKEKFSFLGHGRKVIQPSSSHEATWEVAESCLFTIYSHYGPRKIPTLKDHVVFNTWLKTNVLGEDRQHSY
jgi:serine/threonine protein kinase